MSVILHDAIPVNPSPTPRATCPWFCTDPHTDEPFLDSDGSTLVVHRWTVPEVAGYRVQVRQGVFHEPDGSVTPSTVEVVLDSDPMSADDARRLAAGLARAAEIAGGAR